MAADADGGFVVVWQSYGSSGTDTSDASIQGQRYASDGSTQGDQFQVNTYTTGYQRHPAVAAVANGDFVVVWQSWGSSGTDLSYGSIQGQRFASNGSAQGAQFQVNTYPTGAQRSPSVSVVDDGSFVVVWDGGSSGTDTSNLSIQAQRYASDGSAQGAEFQVNTYTTLFQNNSSVAAAANGDFVVVWNSEGSSGTDTSILSIQAQRYASDGSAQGAEFQINTFTTGFQRHPSVAVEPDGDFVVVWDSDGSYGTDTSNYSIQGQRFASDGSGQGTEFQVNIYTTGTQYRPSVAVEPDGDFVVVWNSSGSSATDTSNLSIQGRSFLSDGSPGSQFQVNTYTTMAQQFPSVAAPDGRFVVAWESDGSLGSDTSSLSVQAQRYVPEPGAELLLMTGVLGLAGLAIRRGRKPASS